MLSRPTILKFCKSIAKPASTILPSIYYGASGNYVTKLCINNFNANTYSTNTNTTVLANNTPIIVNVKVGNSAYVTIPFDNILELQAYRIIQTVSKDSLFYGKMYDVKLIACKAYVLRSCSKDIPDPHTEENVSSNWIEIGSHKLKAILPQITPTTDGNIYIKIVIPFFPLPNRYYTSILAMGLMILILMR